MIEQVKEVLRIAAPWVAGVLSSGIVTVWIKKIIVSYLKKKIDDASTTAQNEKIMKELEAIKKEINILRGKSE